MQTSGLVLDIYDDSQGEVLRSLFPSQDSIPESIKTAHALSSEDRHRLPDDAFALVLVNGEQRLRKFACVDEGNTRLSLEYFLKHAHKLPTEAQKVAAVNIRKACIWYDIEVPEKLAELTGTHAMPLQSPIEKKPGGEKAVVAKTAGALRPHVDVSSSEAPVTASEKKASVYALPSEQKYPLDNYVQVKQASVYFDEYWNRFSPEDRHEFAVNLVKRSSALSIPVSEKVQKYGSEQYAPEEEIKTAFELRQKLCAWDGNATALLHELFDNRDKLEPAKFAAALEEFDKVAHLDFQWDQGVPDPYYSTFGVDKYAGEWSEIIGNDMVTESTLECVAKKCANKLMKVFSEDFVDEFRKDPIGIFKSLPVDQKKILARMANETAL